MVYGNRLRFLIYVFAAAENINVVLSGIRQEHIIDLRMIRKRFSYFSSKTMITTNESQFTILCLSQAVQKMDACTLLDPSYSGPRQHDHIYFRERQPSVISM